MAGKKEKKSSGISLKGQALKIKTTWVSVEGASLRISMRPEENGTQKQKVMTHPARHCFECFPVSYTCNEMAGFLL